MPKREDENEAAFATLQELMRRGAERDGISRPEPSKPEGLQSAVEAGRKGGKRGGPARAAKLSKKKRKGIAKKGAHARWRNQVSLIRT